VFKNNRDISLIPALIIFFILACAGAKREGPGETPLETLRHPSDLRVETGDRSLKLTWVTNRLPADIISGYNIYIAESPILAGRSPRLAEGVVPFNNLPYPGDDDPETRFETFSALGLENGRKYYVAVTTVYPGQVESVASNVVEVTCYPVGTVTLKDRSMGDQHGFCFDERKYVDYNSFENDLYFIARDNGNQLGSPDRNEGVLRHTLFAEIPLRGELDDRIDFSGLRFVDRSFVAEGKIYLLKLHDNSLVKIKIRRVDSSAFKKQIVFDYLFLGKEP